MVLKSMNEDTKEETLPPISEDQWINHFQSLHSETENNEDQVKLNDSLKTLEEQHNKSSFPNPITEEEILDNIRRLKNKKAAYTDKIKNEMIKASSIQTLIKRLPQTFQPCLEIWLFSK